VFVLFEVEYSEYGMRHFLFSIVIFWGLSVPAIADDFDKGVTAYSNGDYISAIQFWTPLAERGNNLAQYNLGVVYEHGEGVPKDAKIAVKWYTLAAEQGDATAQFSLGLIYRNGKGIPQNYETAVKWYTFAAEQGYTKAQYNLGLMHYNGEGVLLDFVYAHMWADISASKGSGLAMKLLKLLTEKMNSTQIAEAHVLAKKCIDKNYNDC
jgi:hypothetical protein